MRELSVQRDQRGDFRKLSTDSRGICSRKRVKRKLLLWSSEPMFFPPMRYVSLAGLAVVAGGAIFAYVHRRKPVSPLDVERQRRDDLNIPGRILVGTILDLHESPAAGDPNA